MLLEMLAVSLFTSLLCLDRRAIGQTMVSQPIVAVSLLGFAFDQGQLGLSVGCVLQLLWMSASLYGANIPQNETIASCTAVGALFISMKQGYATHDSAWVVAVGLTAPTALASQWIQKRLDQRSSKFSQRADASAASDKTIGLSRFIFASLVQTYVTFTFTAFLSLLFALMALYLVEPLYMGSVGESLDTVGRFILPALGVAVSVSLIRRRSHLTAFAFTFVAIVLFFDGVQGGL